jgi:hypothetical protein
MDFEQVAVVAAYSTPVPLPVDDDERLEQRMWAIRLSSDVSPGWNTEEVAAGLDKQATSALRTAHSERDLRYEDIGLPTIRVLLVDPRHLFLNITTPRMDRDAAESDLVAACAALRALEQIVPIEDVQGIPRRYWRIFMGPEGQDTTT